MLEPVSEKLDTLRPGDRFWFWLCTEVSDAPALLIEPLRTDPGMRSLKEQSEKIKVPLTASPFIGLGNVTGDGRIRLGGPLASEARLQALCDWVKGNIDQYPNLARLKNATLLNVSSAGTVRGVYEQADLWDGVPDVTFSGTLQQTASRLRKLPPGKVCWFWLAQNGPSDLPFLYLHLVRKDPKGEAFAKAVVLFRRLATQKGTEIRGLAQKTAAGSVILMTNDSTEGGEELLQAVSAADQNLHGLLTDAILIRRENGKMSEIVTSDLEDAQTEESAPATPASKPSVDLSGLSSSLKILNDAGERALFWWGVVSKSNTPMLVVSGDKAELKDTVKALGPASNSIRGMVVVSKKGPLEFRVKTPYPGFISSLAAWTKSNGSDWPALKRLRGSRMLCKNDAGEIVDRQKDDAAW